MSGEKKFQVPDWKSYQVEDIPELEKTERLLAARRLKDPWIRNEVWRYTRANYGGQWRNAAISLGLGFKWAVLAMTLTIAYDILVVTKPRIDPYALRRREKEDEEEW